MRVSAAHMRLVLPVVAGLVAAAPAPAAPIDGPLHATPIPPESETVEGDACMPELAALAVMEKMAEVMGKDADVLAQAEEDLRSQVADCLEGGNDVTEVSKTGPRGPREPTRIGT